MKIKKAACVPLVTYDPFFSVWSAADQLHDSDTVHWSGALQRLKGHLTVDGKQYVFMGERIGNSFLPQTSLEVTATATQYTFEDERVILTCRFTSPLLLEDPVLVSRPCTYLDLTVTKKVPCEVSVELAVTADLVRTGRDALTGFQGKTADYHYAMMGRAVQQPLSGSDDRTTINWGYAYLACREETARLQYDPGAERLRLRAKPDSGKTYSVILAYDDLLSINYFGQWRKAYWTEKYCNILNAIGAAFADREDVLRRCDKLDREIERRATAVGGEKYAYLCNLSYRQSISAHKLITDEEGNLIFLSKENASNGCIGTVDVSYPSVPLYLMYRSEYVKGMLRPIFKFAQYPVWEYDFAPHDVGRYPYAWGQVYASRLSFGADSGHIWDSGKSAVYPPTYQYPAGSDVYHPAYQMPVEECGNMLIMTAAVCLTDGSGDFAKPYMGLLEKWKNYLVRFGADPGDQLCTDDFAGHLEHNVNLSVKAIMGIKAYAILCDMLDQKGEGEQHHNLAREMAASWEQRADAGDHYALAFGSPDTWSLKYNLVWDKLWNTELFSRQVYEREIGWYLKNTGKYGAPLDSRQSYTKSDWIAWCAAMAGQQAKELLDPVADYLENTPDRVPFGDWYDTGSGIHHMFVGRSVQGGIFMPLLYSKKQNERK